MHIIALASHPTSTRGGQELSLYEVCHSLHHRGHSVSLLYLKAGDLLDRYHEFCDHVIGTHAYKVLRRKELWQFFKDFLKIPHVKNGIVYSNQYHDCVMAYALAQTRNIPSVCHLRTPAPKSFDPSDWQLNRSLKGTNEFITISHQMKADWIAAGLPEERLKVVYNGTKLEQYTPTEKLLNIRQEWEIPQKTKVISYVGRLDAIKGVETLINAFSLLVKDGVDAQLLIAGQPTVQGDLRARNLYLQSLHQLPIELGIDHQVRFLGHVPNVVSLYQVSDITVLPSIYPEPFGRSLIESLACGVPVLGSRIGGIPEVLTGELESWLFEPGNPEDLLRAIKATLNWRETNPQLGRRCRQHVMTNFTLERAVDQIEAIMLGLVCQKKQPR